MLWNLFSVASSSAPSEFLATVALQKKAALLQRNNAIIRKNLALLDTFFLRHSSKFLWKRPTAGCIAFPKLLIPGVSIEAFCVDLVEKKG